MKINKNSMLKHKKCLKTLENNGIWPRESGASNPKEQFKLQYQIQSKEQTLV